MQERNSPICSISGIIGEGLPPMRYILLRSSLGRYFRRKCYANILNCLKVIKLQSWLYVKSVHKNATCLALRRMPCGTTPSVVHSHKSLFMSNISIADNTSLSWTVDSYKTLKLTKLQEILKNATYLASRGTPLWATAPSIHFCKLSSSAVNAWIIITLVITCHTGRTALRSNDASLLCLYALKSMSSLTYSPTAYHVEAVLAAP